MPENQITLAQDLDQPNYLARPTQALLLILSLEEDAVARVMKYMSADDMRILHKLSKDEVKADAANLTIAYQNFLMDTQQPVLAPGEGKAYIERLAQRSLGREESKNLFSAKEKPTSGADIEKRNSLAVAKVLAEENPQVIAAVVTELNPAYASEVIKNLDTELQTQVITRLAAMEEIPSSTIDALWRALDEQLADLETVDAVSVDGVGKAASILQRLPMSDTDEVLTTMGEEEPGLAQKLRRAMFSFEDLVNVQGRGMQNLIKEVSNDQLLLALKTASDPLKERILGAVSKRAAELLLDDLATMGPVKLSEVEQAQQEIVDTALRLEAESKIVIAGRGGEELV